MSAVRLRPDCSVDLGAFFRAVVGISSHLDSFYCVFARFFEVSKNFLLRP